MAEQRDWLRLAAAFVLAPLIASALAGIAVPLLFGEPTGEPLEFEHLSNVALLVASVSASIALPTTLSVGLIAHTMSQRRGITAAWAYILTGATAGALVPTFLALFVPDGSIFALCGVPIGALTAFLAWFIRRPDRDVLKPPSAAEAQ